MNGNETVIPDSAGRQRLKKWRRRIPAFVLAVLAGGVIFHWIVPLFYTLPENVQNRETPGIVVLDREGKPLAHLPSPDHYRGGHTSIEDIPQDFINATLAAEDKRFYSHGGIDYLALARAALSQTSLYGSPSGASTITQQLVKLSLPAAPRSVGTKFREWMTARRIEMEWDKACILSSYFDRLDYGNLRLGPAAAAEYYFGKRLDGLSLGQMALLAGLPQAPALLNPGRAPERAIKRRNLILARLKDEFGYDPERIARAMSENPSLVCGRGTGLSPAPHLMARIMRSGTEHGTIHTFLDPDLQKTAVETSSKTLLGLTRQRAGQAAVIVIHNPTGQILAWVGSTNRDDPDGGLYDGVEVPRSAGSTLKPFVYAMAFKDQYWPGHIVADVPISFRNKEGFDAPKNYNHKYMGPVSIRTALACSQNIPAMSVLMNAGGPQRLMPFLQQLGFTTLNKPANHYGPGLAIGNAEVKLVELANAYATLARKGRFLPARWRDDGMNHAADTPVIDESICFMITDILCDKKARIPAFGSPNLLEFNFACAAKTGTSSDFRDNWCIGYTKNITVGVWVGNFNFSRMLNISGISGAGPIFHQVMAAAHKKYPSAFDPPPQGVARIEIDKRNGLQKGAFAIPVQHLAKEWTLKTNPPRTAVEDDYLDGKAILDISYKEWFEDNRNAAKEGYALTSALWEGFVPAIHIPSPGSTLVLDPEIPGKGRFLHLKSNLPDETVWSSGTLRITTRNGKPVAELTPGTHTVTVKNEAWGIQAESTFEVKQL